MKIPLPQPLARPIYRETLAEFDGPDPWNNGAPVRWMLAIYQLSRSYRVEKFELSAANLQGDLPQGHAVGLFSRESNQCYVLPYSLRRVWQQGLLPLEVLPGTLFRSAQAGVVDPELVPVGNHFRVTGVVMLTIGLTMMAAGGVAWLLFQSLESVILCNFIGFTVAVSSSVLFFKYRSWKRQQDRFTRHWLHLAQNT
jgi:hypothetical protein